MLRMFKIWRVRKMSKPVYFTLQELLRSTVALNKRVENLPSWEVISNLHELALFLDGIREAYGKPIYVSSAFRCKNLNSMLKGSSPTSAHQIGFAVDMYVGGGKLEMDKFGRFLVDYLKDKKFDQLLIEKSSTGSYWYHFGLFNNKREQRCQIKNLFV